ncbi:uncharacterized protein LTR77_003343 [Saxophila tyrrhenica]|uniref:Myb-like domain-containing protein n=1 Tax=Saxophila tyrrhenica TaxID=1690608 RepID=A0AAV9PHK0_9PEZI|nr:hypothetical protein LTR77_003343 [Saxophila tyrrhenica]
MPKDSNMKSRVSGYAPMAAPYPTTATGSAATRSAAIWSAADDEILLQARASGLNWGPISTKHFPGKTPNACRKRHERLVEKRHGEDWDVQKLELLAQEYAAVRKEMWEILGARLGEKWGLVEAKCMEKGLKTLLSTARTAHKRNSPSQSGSVDERGTDHHSDSGIGFSDAEMEVDDAATMSRKHATWPAEAETIHQQPHPDHVRSRSLPQALPSLRPLPLYVPPPPPISTQRKAYDFDAPKTTSPATMSFVRHASTQRQSPESQKGRGGMSIQSVLSTEPQCA